MNATQAENLRILIRHMETKVERVLDMNTIRYSCGTPACALGEAACVPAIAAQGLALTERGAPFLCSWHGDQGPRKWAEAAITLFGGTTDSYRRLFGTGATNAWGSNTVTPAEWTLEARKVLAENGYSMDEPKAAQTFERFMAATLKPVQIAVLPSGEWV